MSVELFQQGNTIQTNDNSFAFSDLGHARQWLTCALHSSSPLHENSVLLYAENRFGAHRSCFHLKESHTTAYYTINSPVLSFAHNSKKWPLHVKIQISGTGSLFLHRTE